MRVLFVNQFYLPDAAATGQLLGDLTEGFAGARVVCGAGGYASNLGGGGPASVEVVRVGGMRFGHGVVRKLGSYLAFYLRAFAAVVLGPRADVVVTMTTPPGLGVLGWAAQGWRGSRHVIWEMDVYPDVAEELGTFRKGGWAARLIGGVIDAARRRADAVVVLGRCMAERMAGRGVAWSRIHVCENWADGRLVEVAPFHDAPDLHVLYSGNLGLAHDVETLARAAGRLGPGFRILISGGGPRRGWLERACAGMDWVSFRGYEERERLGTLLAWGDVGLVTQRAETVGTVVPSKVYGVMAAGRPVVYVGPAESEVGRMVEEMGVGWRVSNGDDAALAALFQRLQSDRAELKRVGAQARRVFEERYERDVGVKRVKGVIEQCIRLYS